MTMTDHLIEVHDAMLRGGDGHVPIPQQIAGVQQSVTTLTESINDMQGTWKVARNAIIVGVIAIVLQTTLGLAYLGLKPAARAETIGHVQPHR